jgi:RimJ/RimL family protein N-acetyltransferase
VHIVKPPSEPVIATERLVLRRATRADIDALIEEISDFSVAKMLARVPYPYRRGDADAFLSAAQDPGDRDLPLTIALDGRLIGGIGLSGIRAEREFGYWLGRAHWGNGYATEAGHSFLAHVFSTFGLDVVRSGAFFDNPASLHVQAKLGFERIGTRLVHCLARDSSIEHVDTLLTRERYDALNASPAADRATPPLAGTGSAVANRKEQ